MKNLLRLFLPRKSWTFLGLGILLVFLVVPTAWAQGQSGSNDMAAEVAKLLSLVVNIITFFIMLIINYMGDLFGVEFITGNAPMSTIRPMWIVMRNITNIIFIGILLFLVLSNLFGISNWSVKEKLPKVILSLVAINFSLLAGKVVLDWVHVGTMTVLSIPQDVMRQRGIGNVEEILNQGFHEDTHEKCEVASDPTKCKEFYKRMNELLCRDVTTADTAKVRDTCLFYIDGGQLPNIPKGNSMAAHNLMTAFAVYFFRVEQLPKLAGEIRSWDAVVVNVIFSTVMSLAFFIALLAGFIVLLARVVFFWVFLVFSAPLLAAFIMGFGIGEVSKKLSAYLLAPIKLAAVFAVTFIMMSAMVSFEVGGTNNQYLILGPSLSIFGQGISGILWQIATVMIFWKAAFWALEGSDVQKAVDWIKSTATGLGKMVGSYMTIDRPIFPGKDGKPGQSMRDLISAPSAVSSLYESQKQAASRQKYQQGFQTPAEKKFLKFQGQIPTITASNVVSSIDNFFKHSDIKEDGATALGNKLSSQLRSLLKDQNKGGLQDGDLLDIRIKTLLDKLDAGSAVTANQIKEFMIGVNDKINSENITVPPNATPYKSP